MRRFLKILILVLLTGYIPAGAQENSDGSRPQYLFPEFTTGIVRMKNGREQRLPVNYNTVTEKMVYYQNNNYFDMVSIDLIDTITILRSKFVPAGKLFYEVLYNAPVTLFVQHTGKLMSPGAPAAYGGTSQVSNSKYLNSVELSGGRYNLDLPADFIVKGEPTYWIRIDSVLTSFLNERQFIKIFPSGAQEIKKYIRQYHIKFERLPDVVQLVRFVNDKNIR